MDKGIERTFVWLLMKTHAASNHGRKEEMGSGFVQKEYVFVKTARIAL